MVMNFVWFVAGLVVGSGAMLFVYRNNPEKMKAAADAAVKKYQEETGRK
jgi:hypothetical protein